MRVAPAVRVRPLLLPALLSLGLALLATRPANAQSSTNPPKPQQHPTPPPPEPTPQEQFVAYWTSETGWSSELQLRNNTVGQDLTVTPVLRLANGAETTLTPVAVKSQEVKSIDIAAAIAAASAPQLIGTYGSVALRYSSSGTLYAAMMIRRTGYPAAFHIDATGELPDRQAGSREGIWWFPKDTASDYLILTNQGKNDLRLTLELYDASGRENKQAVLLGPSQTNRLSVRKLVQAAGLTGSYGGIKVSSTAHAGSLDTLHFLFDETGGFSAILKMFDYDPQTKLLERDFAKNGVWTTRAPMLALSNPDPALAFPPGTPLLPQLFIRNTTAKPIDAALRFNWRMASTTGRATGPRLHLLPYETRLVNVAALQDGTILPKQANWTSVTITTNALPNEVMAVAASYDETLKFGAQTPFSDQLSFKWEGGMWEYDPYHNSIITAGNGGTKPTRAAFTFFYNQGTQRYDLEQTLQPDQQMWIDIGKLIREQIPDKNGKPLPSDLTMGSYEFRDLTNTFIGTLFEGKVIYDKTYGHATYGCASCCGYVGTKLWYDPLGVPLSFTSGQGVYGHDKCGGLWEDISDAFYSNWSTANSSIATVDYYGTHTGMSVGSTTSSTDGQFQGWLRLNYCPIVGSAPSGGAKVMSLSCSPSSVARGSSVTCSVSSAPSGATFSSWQFKDSSNNIVSGSGTSSSWSGVMVTSGTVSVSVVAGGGSTPLTASVTVNNRNWHTNPASPVGVSNGTFYALPVPPQLTGNFSGLGISNWRAAYGTLSYSTLNDGGPNQGYTYWPSNFSWTNLDYRYEINPDLQNTGSTFYQAQCGNYNPTTNPGGFISGSNLLTQTLRHEYNSSAESHYAFYSNAISSSADNPGDFLEQQIALPGANLSTFSTNVQSGITSRLNAIGTAATQEDPPWPVNYSESNVPLGNINYAPYTACN